jgi:uncharacterized protein YaiE (UPF0345 family)
MMTSLRLAFCAVTAAASCAACGSPLTQADLESKLKTATASVLKVDPGAVTIVNPEEKPTRWEWKAQSAGQTFECDADLNFTLPDCRALS